MGIFEFSEERRSEKRFIVSKKVKTSKFHLIDNLIIDKLSNEEGQFH